MNKNLLPKISSSFYLMPAGHSDQCFPNVILGFVLIGFKFLQIEAQFMYTDLNLNLSILYSNSQVLLELYLKFYFSTWNFKFVLEIQFFYLTWTSSKISSWTFTWKKSWTSTWNLKLEISSSYLRFEVCTWDFKFILEIWSLCLRFEVHTWDNKIILEIWF